MRRRSKVNQCEKPSASRAEGSNHCTWYSKINAIQAEIRESNQFEEPMINAVSTKQAKAFREEVEEDDTEYLDFNHESSAMTAQEAKNINDL